MFLFFFASNKIPLTHVRFRPSLDLVRIALYAGRCVLLFMISRSKCVLLFVFLQDFFESQLRKSVPEKVETRHKGEDKRAQEHKGAGT